MPKVSRVNKFRVKASVSANDTPRFTKPLKAGGENNTGIENGNARGSSDDKQSLSRGQRKRLAKREQYMKREKMILSSLRVQKLEVQKKKIDGLDAIKEALAQTMQKSMSSNTHGKTAENSELQDTAEKSIIKTNKTKRSLAQKEVSHMSLVLQHPSFQNNPFSTIQEHLRNTLAKQAEEQQVVAEERIQKEKKDASERKELKKEKLRNLKYHKAQSGGARRKRR